jgi:hypothetical protein
MPELSMKHLAAISLVLATGVPALAAWTPQWEPLERTVVVATETTVPPPPLSFKDPGYAHMLSLGFSPGDVSALQGECMDYFLTYYGIDFHGLPAAPDGTIFGDGAMMFGETIPEGSDQRVITDTADPSHRADGTEHSRVVIDTGCAMIILSPGVYDGLNAGMPRTAGDIMVYGYSNVFDPRHPIDKDHIVERIKFKPAWPIKVVPVANAEGASISEAVFKVEAEYVDKQGRVHNGIGICALTQYFDVNGQFHESKRDVYTFPR